MNFLNGRNVVIVVRHDLCMLVCPKEYRRCLAREWLVSIHCFFLFVWNLMQKNVWHCSACFTAHSHCLTVDEYTTTSQPHSLTVPQSVIIMFFSASTSCQTIYNQNKQYSWIIKGWFFRLECLCLVSVVWLVSPSRMQLWHSIVSKTCTVHCKKTGNHHAWGSHIWMRTVDHQFPWSAATSRFGRVGLMGRLFKLFNVYYVIYASRLYMKKSTMHKDSQ